MVYYISFWECLFIARLEYCDVNDDYKGVCKSKNYYIDPKKLYPEDNCTSNDFTAACAYGL